MRLQSEFADYESIRFGLLLVFRFTVEPNVQSLLMGIRCPKTAWETLKMEYCPTPWKVVHELSEKLMNMRYRKNGNHCVFLQRFRELVQRLKAETTIPSWLETSAFLRALSGSPSLHALMSQISTWKDVGASELYQAFWQFEGSRKALNGGKQASRPEHCAGKNHRKASTLEASTTPHLQVPDPQLPQAPGLHPQPSQPPVRVTKGPRSKRDVSVANLSADDLYGPHEVRLTTINQRER